MGLSLEEGRAAVGLARLALEARVNGTPRPRVPSEGVLEEKRGVFVTLNVQEGGNKYLRGCIGYTEPIKPLGEAIVDVAAYACEDPRFPSPVGPEELGSIVVEVSVLTLASALSAGKREDLPSKVRVGTDGLIVSNGFASGLLLPQVAPEQGWDQETFLSQACLKAGLSPDSWLDRGTRIEVFQAEIFSEESPRGEVVRAGSATGT